MKNECSTCRDTGEERELTTAAREGRMKIERQRRMAREYKVVLANILEEGEGTELPRNRER